MTHFFRASYCCLCALVLALFAVLPVRADSVSTFSSSPNYLGPESISFSAAGWAALAPPGPQLIVVDAGTQLDGPSSLYAISAGGGSPTTVSSGIPANLVSGTFAPFSSGSLSNTYIAAGYNVSGAVLYSIGSFGVAHPINSVSNSVSSHSFVQYGAPIAAPSGFGSVAGTVLVPLEASAMLGTQILTGTQIVSLDSSGAVSNFGNALSGIEAFGTVFAPTGFGSVGGMLLLSDEYSGEIVAIDSSGNEHPFADLNLPGLEGLRQMAFAPAGFGSYGGDLFVSVAGQYGSVSAGEIVVLDDTGNVIAYLDQGVNDAPIDPRGLFFLGNSELVFSDTDPSLLAATPDAFTAAPEPASASLITAAFLLAAIFLRKRVIARIPKSA